MKGFIKDVLYGIVIIIVITILEFIVTIPFGEVSEEIDNVKWASMINLELLLTALPATVTTLVFAWLLKTKSKADALKKGIIWTSILALNYILIGIGNNNIRLIFGKIGIYVLLACAFAGTFIYVKIKHLN
ncbi:MAG: hypothetical protein LLF98_12450 [Clostridium sp.]|uniref:hypothetical protein n=1 Tax=Clostridium sp. TaxID=1506 RepID=UPI0025BE1313|nr:hypothetical protein [Clostridium sp.]MCE5222028.1 hypothetical protein [Clostridium sp.]